MTTLFATPALGSHDSSEATNENKIVAKTGCFVIYCDLPIPVFKDFPLNLGIAPFSIQPLGRFVSTEKKDIFCSYLIF